MISFVTKIPKGSLVSSNGWVNISVHSGLFSDNNNLSN